MGKGLAGTALGFGIAAIVIGWIPVLGWLIAIAALVIAIVAMVKCKTPEEGRGMAVAGLVTSIIGVVLIPVWLFLFGLLMFQGIMASDSFLPDTCTFEQEFGCRDFQALEGGDTVRFTLVSNVGEIESITLTATSAGGKEVSCARNNLEFTCSGLGEPLGARQIVSIEGVYRPAGGTIDRAVSGGIVVRAAEPVMVE